MTDIINLPYRPCAGIAILNADSKILVGKRLDNQTAWQLPQGGIDDGEDLKIAAYREMAEEIGTNKADIIEIIEEKFQYDLPPELFGKLWGGKYRGQEQTWIILRFTGVDADIDLNAHEPAEFSEWKWVDIDQICDLVVPFKRQVYERLIPYIKKHI